MKKTDEEIIELAFKIPFLALESEKQDVIRGFRLAEQSLIAENEALKKRIVLVEGDLQIAKASWNEACNDIGLRDARIESLQKELEAVREELKSERNY